MKMSSNYKSIFMQMNSFCPKTRFETEAQGNLEMAYFIYLVISTKLKLEIGHRNELKSWRFER